MASFDECVQCVYKRAQLAIVNKCDHKRLLDTYHAHEDSMFATLSFRTVLYSFVAGMRCVEELRCGYHCIGSF